MEQRITADQAASLAANAPSRQVRRSLQRRVDKHNRHVDWQEEMMVLRHRTASRKSSAPRVRTERVSYPAGEDQRHDKYLHAGARRGRAMRMAGMGA